MKLSIALVVFALPLACASAPSSTPVPEASSATDGAVAETEDVAPEAEPSVGTCPDGQHPEIFGDKIDPAGRTVMPLEDVLEHPEAYTDRPILVSGVVRANCTKKGCWMDIRPEEDRLGSALTVRFKGYRFFIPLNSRGSTVKVDGSLALATLSPEEVEHLEHEGAVFPTKEPDGSVKQVELTATGVEMCGRERS